MWETSLADWGNSRARSHRRAAGGWGVSCAYLHLCAQVRHIDPAPLLPGLQTEVGQLHPARARQQVPGERRIAGNGLEEKFPLIFEGVVKGSVVWHLLPIGVEIQRFGDIGVPDGTRRVHTALDFARSEPGDNATMGAVHLYGQQFIAID